MGVVARSPATNVECRRRGNDLTTKVARRAFGSAKADHPSMCFRGYCRQGPRGGRAGGDEGKTRRTLLGLPDNGRPNVAQPSSPGLRLNFTPTALVGPLATLSAGRHVTCAAQRPRLPDAPSWPYDVTSVSHHGGSNLPDITGVTSTASIAMITMAVASTTIATD